MSRQYNKILKRRRRARYIKRRKKREKELATLQQGTTSPQVHSQGVQSSEGVI